MDYEAYAKKFYGASCHNAKNPTKLHDACKWLDKAIGFEARVKAGNAIGGGTWISEFEAKGELGVKKTEMAFGAALKAEAEAFA